MTHLSHEIPLAPSKGRPERASRRASLAVIGASSLVLWALIILSVQHLIR